MKATLQQLADFCRALPGASEDIKWGNDLVFSVGGRMFCAFGIDNDDLVGLSFKVEDHRFLEYTDRAEFMPAPYLARARWVSLVEGKTVSTGELKACIRTSHGLVLARLSKKKQREILEARPVAGKSAHEPL